MFHIYTVKFSHPTYQIRKILRPYIINTHFRTLNFNILPAHLIRRTWEFFKGKFFSLPVYLFREWGIFSSYYQMKWMNFDIFLTVLLHRATKFSHPATKFSHPATEFLDPATGWNGCNPMGMGLSYILNETLLYPEWDIPISWMRHSYILNETFSHHTSE